MTREEAKAILKGFTENPLYSDIPKVCRAFDMAIKALEQQPCEDLISRKAAKRILEDRFMELQKLHDDKRYETNYCLNTILELPPVTPKAKWIPVSERLPKDIKPVIVTWKNTDPKSYYQYIVGKHFIGTAHYKGDKWFWYSSVTEDLLAEYGKCDSEEF